MDRDGLAGWLRITLTPGLGPATARRLLAAFGLPLQVLAQGRTALAQVVDPAIAGALKEPAAETLAQIEATFAWLDADPAHRGLLALGDPEYPAALLDTEDPPLLLYVMGALALRPGPCIGVVGSRNPTPQGVQNARLFSRSLAASGACVVSGLALGVDAAAHEGALEGAPPGRLATIAVVGTGLDRVYPRQHHALAHRIAERGWLLSEYPLGTPPAASNFPRRNRLIAGLGPGTLVVEAALQSGSLITARLAAEQGREVFAIPGSIHSPQSRGCHLLLRQGAKLVESAEDVLEELRLEGGPARHPGAPAEPPAPTPLLEALGYDPVGLDALVARTGIPAHQLQAELLELELAGHVARLPGGLFQRIAAA